MAGTDRARNDSGRLAHLPPDPAHAEVASNHTYNFTARGSRCRGALARISRATRW